MWDVSCASRWFRHEGGKRTGSEPSTCGRRPARTLIKSPVARLAVYASLNGWGWVGEGVTCNLQRFLVTSSPTRHMYSTEPPAQSLAQDVLIPRARSRRNGAS